MATINKCSIVLFKVIVLLGLTKTVPVIDKNPGNSTVTKNTVTLCDCVFSNTGAVPYWNIDDMSYPPTMLPSGCWATPEGLLVTAIRNSSYQCFLPYLTMEKQIDTVESNIGYLTVYDTEDDDECVSDVRFSRIMQLDNNQLLLEWSHTCCDECTHFNLSVQSCSNSNDILYKKIPNNINTTCIDTSSHVNEDIVIIIQICTNNKCKPLLYADGQCRSNSNAFRINVIEDIGMQIPILGNGMPCFNTSFFQVGNTITPSVLINGIIHEVPISRQIPLHVDETGNTIAYVAGVDTSLSLCIINTTEAVRMFEAVIVLQEIKTCRNCSCNKNYEGCTLLDLTVGKQMIYNPNTENEIYQSKCLTDIILPSESLLTGSVSSPQSMDVVITTTLLSSFIVTSSSIDLVLEPTESPSPTGDSNDTVTVIIIASIVGVMILIVGVMILIVDVITLIVGILLVRKYCCNRPANPNNFELDDGHLANGGPESHGSQGTDL